MTCDELLDRAVDIVDGGDLPPAVRAAVDAHLDTCAACRATVADLRAIRLTAATLERRLPPPALWTRIAAGLRAEPEFRRVAGPRGARGLQPFPGVAWLAAAAVLVVLVGGALWYVARTFRSDPARTTVATTSPERPGADEGNASPTALVESIEAELELAADHYERAIAGLEQVANQSESPLDAELTAMLRKNLEVIDGAIAESRSALRADPQSRVAQESLFEAFRRKIGLLQDTIALMNEMRKGNQAGAARIVEGLSKS